MARIHVLEASIHKLEGAVANCERHIAQNPQDWDAHALLNTALASLNKRRQEYEAHVRDIGAETVSYSLMQNQDDRILASSLSQSLAFYEKALLVTTQSIIEDRPQEKAVYTNEVKDMAFRYGYLFSENRRHLGMMMRTKRKQQLELALDENDPLQEAPDVKALRQAVTEISGLVHPRAENDLAVFRKKHGPAAVRQLGHWADNNMVSNLDVFSEFGEGKNRIGIKASPVDSHSLREKISFFSEQPTSSMKKIDGLLLAINFNTKHFSFRSNDGEVYSGRFDRGVFSQSHMAHLPAPYTAHIQSRKRLNELTDETVVTYKLAGADELPIEV